MMDADKKKIIRFEPSRSDGKVPPHDLDAEAAVLSAVMLSREAFDETAGTLKPEYFYADANGRIYEAACTLARDNRPIDTVTVAGWLRDRQRIDWVGGLSYLAQLVDATPNVANVVDYARVIYEKWRLRQLIAQCQKTAAEGYGDVGDPQAFVDAHEQQVFGLAHGAESNQVQRIDVAMRSAFAKIYAASQRGDRITGLATGYDRLDGKTSGLHDGDLTIVAARPGMGKTAFVLNIGVNVASPRLLTDEFGAEALVPGWGVVIFSLEMPREQLATRIASTEAKVDLGRIRQGFLEPHHWQNLTAASQSISAMPIWIDDTPAIGLLEMRAKVRRIQAAYNRPATASSVEQKIRLVIVDYLQLMSGRKGVTSREQEISEISRGLKQLAKELSVPVIALSQLNRAVEMRQDKRPQISDLRESGAIEQDSDMIVFIYRDEYYNPETSDAKGIAELIIAKQRNGPTGKVMVSFQSSCTRFDNLEFGAYPESDT